MKPSLRKEMAQKAIIRHQVSIRFAYRCMGVSETCFRYQPSLSSENAIIADWLLRLTPTNKRWGFGLCFMYFRNVKGFGWNHKRVHRIYRGCTTYQDRYDKPQATKVLDWERCQITSSFISELVRAPSHSHPLLGSIINTI